MKKFCITILVFTIIILSGIGLNLSSEQTNVEYLRIHIRANSNEDIDQAVKYKVKDAVVQYLAPYIADCKTKTDAERMLKERLNSVTAVADGVLRKNGFDYGSKSSVKREEFPTRVYGELQLEKGFYDALIVELGNGKGDNWWCVVYPPLCFVSEGVSYVYKSKIKDVIDDFFKKEK